MDIKHCEFAIRYYVCFTVEESNFLREKDFLHPASSDASEMWVTSDELELMRREFPELAGSIDAALEKTKDIQKQARQTFLLWVSTIDNT